jgi:hypothetical protein
MLSVETAIPLTDVKPKGIEAKPVDQPVLPGAVLVDVIAPAVLTLFWVRVFCGLNVTKKRKFLIGSVAMLERLFRIVAIIVFSFRASYQ